ncbi:MAG: GNAT family N-acetyltransferase [Thaumarchaeota archaeon]|nr:GNAT family N-acetyltransferase [Nitrososphaerota archaeon]MCH8973135.1 GNAT family N-acetyltransferase [Nitrososphaerota archaeon]
MNQVKIRQIQENDLFQGFLESLDSLRKASDLEEDDAKLVLKKIRSNQNHVVMVADSDGQIVGSITLLIEPKFIHQGGLVGHIEDVVVRSELQGKGIGEQLVNAALEYAKNHGCYKTILDCDDNVKPFYEKIGFKRNSNAMRFDHN